VSVELPRLTRPVDGKRDHVAGRGDAPIELVEYGDYECPHCRAANDGVQRIRERFGERLRYVFRHLPNPKLHPNAELAAEAAEAASAQGRIWEMHEALLAEPIPLGHETLVALAGRLGLDVERFAADLESRSFAARVREDLDDAVASGAHGTPTFYVNGRRYDGAWDEESLRETIEQPLAFRVRRLSQDFAGLPAASGAVLLASAGIALLWANSPWAASYTELWQTPLALRLGSSALVLSLAEWINQGLMAIFFLVVGLELKREVTTGQLASARKAALPVAAAAGGMLLPAALYALFNFGGPYAHGWGIPMSTDTAFALGLLALLGPRVPFSLKVFVAALAIADDVGAILVITLFYATEIAVVPLAAAGLAFAAALAMNRARVYHPLPYALVGACLWLGFLYSGIHATIAGVLLAAAIPTRSPPATSGLLNQSVAAFRSFEAPLPTRALDEGHYQATVRVLETVVGRLLSPAQRLERDLQPWSAYFVLPLLALANAGVSTRVAAGDWASPVSVGIVAGLVLGKPLGIALACVAVVKARVTALPPGVSWRWLMGAACLCGIGFTMSIFIADSAFEQDAATLALAKLSIIAASVIASALGWSLLRGSRSSEPVAQSPVEADEPTML
jgi:NhaA family Na+:H+ antiporter